MKTIVALALAGALLGAACSGGSNDKATDQSPPESQAVIEQATDRVLENDPMLSRDEARCMAEVFARYLDLTPMVADHETWIAGQAEWEALPQDVKDEATGAMLRCD